MSRMHTLFTFAEMSIESGLCPLAVGLIPAAPPGGNQQLKKITK